MQLYTVTNDRRLAVLTMIELHQIWRRWKFNTSIEKVLKGVVPPHKIEITAVDDELGRLMIFILVNKFWIEYLGLLMQKEKYWVDYLSQGVRNAYLKELRPVGVTRDFVRMRRKRIISDLISLEAEFLIYLDFNLLRQDLTINHLLKIDNLEKIYDKRSEFNKCIKSIIKDPERVALSPQEKTRYILKEIDILPKEAE